MNKKCDLHTHSVFSDGTYTPTELVNEAVKIGLGAIALTDHNTVEGLPEFLRAASGKKIETIPGAEFSVDFEGTELHMLGLFISEEYFSQVSELMLAVNNRKEQSNIALIDSLSRVGIDLDYDLIKRSTPSGKINRAHIAAALVQKGYVGSISQAFETYLSPSAGHYKEPERLTVWEIMDFIISIGALPILAHPFLNLSEERLQEFLPKAKKRGLCGMECFYSLYDLETTQKALYMAEKFDLLCSGGSDFHGDNKPDIGLGIGKGSLNIPFEVYLAMKGIL